MSTESKYEKIYKYILNKIRNGEYLDGKIESENILCKMFDVSRPTVRQAITKLESGGYVNRIKGSGVYTSFSKYKSLHTHKKKNTDKKIGVILPEITNPVIYEVFSQIESVLTGEECKVLLKTTNYSVVTEREAMLNLYNENVDIIIMTAANSSLPWINKKLYEEISASGIPFLFLSDSYGDDYIGTNDYEIANTLTRMITDNAHASIICLLEANSRRSYNFYDGIISCLTDYNVNLKNVHFLWYSPEDPENDIKNIDFHNYTACIAQNDSVASIVIEKAKSFPIPERLSVACIESIDTVSPLTSGIYPVEAVVNSVITAVHSLLESNIEAVNSIHNFSINHGNTVVFSSSHNPFIAGDWADPYILNDNGEYYLYPTTNWQNPKIYAFQSKDIFHWKNPIEVFNATSASINGAAWAPSVIHYKDLYYMVYCNESSLIYCYSQSPLGPFNHIEDVNIKYHPFPFDPHMFIDDGNIYLIYGMNCCYLVPLKIEGISIKQIGEAIPLTKYIIGSDSPTYYDILKFNGGARLTKINNKYLLTWFCYHTTDPRCQIKYAWSDNISGPYIPAKENILLKGNNVIQGVSHAQIVAKGNEYYVFYNRLNTNAVKQERELCFEKIEIMKDGKIISSPT